MYVKTISVGQPQLVKVGEENFVTTSIFKNPVEGKVHVGQLNLEGDAQADLTVHGGWSKAVYAYPAEHYEYWAEEMPDYKLEPANFGENLTTEGLIESDVFIGDRFRIGSAEFVVTEPRMPCYKLGIRFGRKDIIRRFLQSRRSGFYLAVETTGEIEAGNKIERLSRDENEVTVTDIVRIFVEDKDDRATIEHAMKLETLPDGWKDSFRSRL